MSAAALIHNYSVPASRVVGVTPMLGRPLSTKKRSEGVVDYASAMTVSSSLPAIGGSSKASRGLSLDELRVIALCNGNSSIGPAAGSKKANLGKLLRQPVSKPPLMAAAEGSAHSRNPVLPADVFDRASSAPASTSRKAKRRGSDSPLARLAALSRPQPDGATVEEGGEGGEDDAYSEDEEDPYDHRTMGDKIRKPWSPDNDNVVAGPSKGKKKEPAGNPFVGADESGRKLQWERKWLVENPEHLEMRRRQFQTDGRLTSLASKQMDPDLAYEMKVCFGAYSMQVKANVMQRQEKRRLRESGMTGETVAKRPVSATATMNSTLAKADQSQAQPTEKRSRRGPQEQACVRMLRQLQKELQASHPDTKAQSSKTIGKDKKADRDGQYGATSARGSSKPKVD